MRLSLEIELGISSLLNNKYIYIYINTYIYIYIYIAKESERNTPSVTARFEPVL